MIDLSQIPTNGEEWECLRNARGLTRAELARRVACDPSTLWALENNRPVSDRVRLLVGAALGLQVFPVVEVEAEVGAAA